MVIDDDRYLCQTLKDALERYGYDVSTAGDGVEAIEMARGQSYDLFFIDVKLPSINGLQTYLALKEINPEAVAIMMTGYRFETAELVKEAIASSIYTCLYKPFDLQTVVKLVERVRRGRLHGDLTKRFKE